MSDPHVPSSIAIPPIASDARGVSDEIELSIVMPCLNEAVTLPVCIDKARGFLERSGVRGEVVVADNGSTDGSQDIARQRGARVVDVPLRGYGAALYYGSLAARGRFIVMGDSDDSYDFSDLMPFVAKLREGYELVMGNRFMGGIKPGAMPWKNRYIGNPVLTGIGRLLFRCPARDFHCGLRGYRVDAFRRMDLRTTGMEFASEMVIKATLLGMKITEVPTTLSPDGRGRPPHLRPWRDGWRHLRFMLLYSPRWLFLYPGLALIIIGTVVGAWLLPGPRRIGGVEFDVHTLLYAAVAIILGTQSVGLAVLTKVFTIAEGLLPADRRITDLLRRATLEFGLVIGLALLMMGVATSAWEVWWWKSRSFGQLNTSQVLREVIPAVLAMVLGAQVMMFSLFLGVLGLRTRPLERG